MREPIYIDCLCLHDNLYSDFDFANLVEQYRMGKILEMPFLILLNRIGMDFDVDIYYGCFRIYVENDNDILLDHADPRWRDYICAVDEQVYFDFGNRDQLKRAKMSIDLKNLEWIASKDLL